MSKRIPAASPRGGGGGMLTSTFREDSPRPPVPGEEDVDCQPLTSHSTSKQPAPFVEQSFSKFSDQVAPRRFPPFHADSTVAWGQRSGKDSQMDCDDAPLGFEPEGSTCKSPPYLESTVYSDG